MRIVSILILFVISIYSSSIIAKPDSTGTDTTSLDDLLELSLDELLEVKINVASGEKAMTQRESPGIVSLVTSEEIRKSGARDLIDVFRLVPGFTLGLDTYGLTGLLFRGQNCYGARILMLIDGQEIIDDLWGQSMELGHHFPVELIDRIEIIRGPGSALYGGYAELGVINIITKKTMDKNNALLSTTFGMMEDSYGRVKGCGFYGKHTEDVSFSVSAYGGQGIRSDRNFSDFYGNTFDMQDNTEINNVYTNSFFRYKNFDIRFISDRYSVWDKDGFSKNRVKKQNNRYPAYLAETKYQHKFNENLSITPIFRYKYRVPYYREGKSKKPIQKYFGNIQLSYDIARKHNLLLGVDFYCLNAKDKIGSTTFNGENNVTYYNTAGYVQGLFITKIANITIGGRLDYHSEAATSFVPRLSLTKNFRMFHYKALAGQAFRSPAVMHAATYLDTTGEEDHIQPERSTVVECELGIQPVDMIYFAANVFYMHVKDVIQYYYLTPQNEDHYMNSGVAQSKGFELISKFKHKWASFDVTYSYYLADKNIAAYYYKDQLLGQSPHKLTFSGSVSMFDNLHISPSLMFVGKRYGASGIDTSGDLIIGQDDPKLLANITALYDNLFFKGLSASISCFNIKNEKYNFYQYYTGGHAPYPDASREFVFRLSYRL